MPLPGRLTRRTVPRRTVLWGLAALAAGGAIAAPAPELRFLAVGDWGEPGSPGQDAVARAMTRAADAAPPDFVVSLGDNFYPRGVGSVDDPEWRTAFEAVYSAPSLQCPWYAVLGNHDLYGDPEAEIAYTTRDPRWHMPGRFYTVAHELGDGTRADFFFLDTSVIAEERLFDAAAADRQVKWLAAALAGSAARWKIVCGHHPVFSGGRHGSSAMLVRWVRPLLERHGVAAYFNGHDHDLEHLEVDGVHYLTVGAGSETRPGRPTRATLFGASELGFLSARLRPDALDVTFVGADGRELHRATIPPRG